MRPMSDSERRLSRPLYEALPWIYILCGLVALVGSYLHASRGISLALGLPGLLAVLAGVVVILRRRDYRQMKANNYLNTDSSALSKPED
jgi:membrane associated rhomboid family serine protease